MGAGGLYVIRADGTGLTPILFSDDWKRNPDWYYNLLTHPEASIEVGTANLAVNAVIVTGESRDRLFQRLAEAYSQFDYYQGKTRRTIPVVIPRPFGA